MSNRLSIFLVILVACCHLQGGDVLASGNSFNTSDPEFAGNLAKLSHTFQFVSQASFRDQDFNGFDAIWLDGFSSYGGIPNQELMSFMENGGTLVVQNPGLGGESLNAYPFGDELHFVFLPDGGETVRVVAQNHPLNFGVTDASLSNWSPAANLGYFDVAGGFSGLTDNGTDGRWVTLVRDVGSGFLVYTQQILSQSLQESDLDPASGQLTFLDNLFSQVPALEPTPPRFLGESNFWFDTQGNLKGLLPHPNADGLDPTGSAELAYQLTLETDNGVVYGPEFFEAGPWPMVMDVAANLIPEDPFYIGFARVTGDSGKRAEPPPKILIRSPQKTPQDPGVPRLYRRWLVHLPRIAGGFGGTIQVANPNPEDPVTVVLRGYESDGSFLAMETVEVAPSEDARFELYGQGETGIFSAESLVDRISHLAIWEAQNTSQVSLQYLALNSGFGVWVDEINLDTQPVSGSLFKMDGATPNGTYYDGVAVLNLSGALTPEILVNRFDEMGNPAGTLSLGNLPPGSKLISALSFAFDGFVANPTYQIEAISPSGQTSIQVLGLSGTTSGEFFAPARVTRKR